MATYVLPQVRVFQEFNIAAEADIRDLFAFITGGHAYLLRCDVADEKALAGLGEYDDVGTLIDGDFKTCYSWPTKPAGSVIDTTYTKLCIDDALLKYFEDTSHTMTKTDSNKIRHPTKSFKDNPSDPTTYPRSAADFFDRDVAVGDIVKVSARPVTGTISSSSVLGTRAGLCTYVKDIEAEVVAASIAAATGDTANQATQSASSSDSANAGNSGDATIASTDETSYDGHDDGDMTEVYTVRVIVSSTGGDATTGRLQVISASGNDDVSSVTPVAFGVAQPIGARGGTATFSGGSTNFTAGDEWTVTMNQAFTAPTATSGGTYTGTTDRTYEITVTKGGLYAASPEITVTTTDGTDFSGPTIVSATATNVAVGQYGVLVQFNSTALRKGDRYHIVATAASEGAFKTLVLGHDLDTDVALDDADDSEIELVLYIKKDLEVGEQHVRISGQYNWDQSDTEFCVHAGIEAYDDTWTNAGVPIALEVTADADCANTNQMYVEYRAWRSDLANSVSSIADVANLDTAISGPLTPDNPLKYALSKALQNNNGIAVKYMAVADPTASASWTSVLDEIEERTDVYNLVPLTKDTTILNLFQAHIQSQSTPEMGRYRAAFFNLKNDPTVAVIDSTVTDDGLVVLATTEDDPDTSGTQYTYMRVTSVNTNVIEDGLRVGDTVRYQYATDAWGNVTYNEYVVDAIINEVTVRLVTGTAVAESTPKKVEFWRNLDETEQSEAIALTAGVWASSRICAVWPDTIDSAGETVDGFHLCAALAALVGGVVPHQGLTHLQILGFDNVPRTTELFNRSQLDHLAGNGTWIVTQDPKDGEVFTRHAVTTDDYTDINVREEMVRRNVDSISFYWLDKFAPYIGVSNVTPNMLDIIEAEVRSGIEFLRTSNETRLLGGQLIDAEISELRESVEFKDRSILGLDLTIPYALNNLDVHLLI